jgi:hypothetical protein
MDVPMFFFGKAYDINLDTFFTCFTGAGVSKRASVNFLMY